MVKNSKKQAGQLIIILQQTELPEAKLAIKKIIIGIISLIN